MNDRATYGDCSYEDWWEAFWCGLLNCCACGEPKRFQGRIVDYLAWCGRDRKAIEMPEWERGSYRDDLTLFIAYLCDAHHLTEHGVSIGYPWLTEDGEMWFERLRG